MSQGPEFGGTEDRQDRSDTPQPVDFLKDVSEARTKLVDAQEDYQSKVGVLLGALWTAPENARIKLTLSGAPAYSYLATNVSALMAQCNGSRVTHDAENETISFEFDRGRLDFAAEYGEDRLGSLVISPAYIDRSRQAPVDYTSACLIPLGSPNITLHIETQ